MRPSKFNKIIGPVLVVLFLTYIVLLGLIRITLPGLVESRQEALYNDRIKVITEILKLRAGGEGSGEHAASQMYLQTDAVQELRHIYYKTKNPRSFPFICSKAGSVIMHPTLPVGAKGLQQLLPKTPSRGLRHFSRQYTTPQGEKRWVQIRYFQPWNWYIGWSVPARNSAVQVGRLFNTLAIALAVAFGGTGCLLYFLLWRTLRRVRTSSAPRKTAGLLSAGETTKEQHEELDIFVEPLPPEPVTLPDSPDSQREERLYRELVQSANCIILRWDPEGNILFMNNFGLELYGFSAEELVGRPMVGTIVPETPAASRDLKLVIREIVTNPERCTMNKTENIRKDGTSLWIQWSTRAIADEQGNLLEMLSIGIDVTALTRATRKLRVNEQRYQTLFDSSHDAYFILIDGLCVHCNKKALQFLGCTKKQIIGKSLGAMSPLFQPDGTDSMQAAQEKIKKAYQGVPLNFEWCYQTASGELREAEVNLNCIETDSGKFLLASVHDITDRKQLEEELRHTQKMEAIGTLAGGIAHDFNNILTAIMGYTELAQMKLGTESPVAEELDQVYIASKRARELVQQILTYSRKAPQVKQTIKLATIVKEAMKLLRSSIPATIEIQQEISSERLVYADPTQIHQVLMNLCTNSHHAMEENGGVLTVRVKDLDITANSTAETEKHELEPGLYTVLEVSDTGCGMDLATMKNIFDPYFTTKEHGKGSGMGLAVVHGIIQSHNAHITVSSKVGQGTTFRIFFHVAPEPAPADEQHGMEETAEQEERNERILFVDDELAICNLAEKFLEAAGYRVETFQDVTRAWEVFSVRPERWDLLITDQTMPQMTGMEFIAKARALRPELPVILCSGYRETISTEQLQKMAVNVFIQKPTPMDKLLSSIRKILRETEPHHMLSN